MLQHFSPLHVKTDCNLSIFKFWAVFQSNTFLFCVFSWEILQFIVPLNSEMEFKLFGLCWQVWIWCAGFTHIPTHPHKPHSRCVCAPLYPMLLFIQPHVVLLGFRIESLGGPYCSPVLMHLLSLLGMKRGAHTGEGDGLEAEKETEDI